MQIKREQLVIYRKVHKEREIKKKYDNFFSTLSYYDFDQNMRLYGQCENELISFLKIGIDICLFFMYIHETLKLSKSFKNVCERYKMQKIRAVEV